jgi:hypothetical protein
VTAVDVPNDRGEALTLNWTASPDEKAHPERLLIYRILRADAQNGPFVAVDSVSAGTTSKNDEKVQPGKSYWYHIAAVGPGGVAESADAVNGLPTAQARRMLPEKILFGATKVFKATIEINPTALARVKALAVLTLSFQAFVRINLEGVRGTDILPGTPA